VEIKLVVEVVTLVQVSTNKTGGGGGSNSSSWWPILAHYPNYLSNICYGTYTLVTHPQ
jgi:hypothetical protein